MAGQKRVGTEQERNKAEQGMERLKQRGGTFVQAVEATRMPMVVTDPTIADNPIIFANPAFLEMCGYSMEEVLGRNYYFLSGPSTDPEVRQRIDRAVTARQDIVEEVQVYTKDGREIWVSMFVSPTIENDRIVRHFASLIDITDRVQAQHRAEDLAATLEQQVRRRTRRLEMANQRLQEEIERRQRLEAVLRDTMAQDQEHLRQKEFLITEVHHRTKNAIAMTSALLQIQARHSESAETRQALKTAQERLSRIAEVYALLHQGGMPDRVEVADYLHRLIQGLITSFQPEPGQVGLRTTIEEVTWGSDLVVPLGLIVNEAITNAMKYAFPNGRKGCVQVDLGAAGNGLMRLCIEDDGVGLAEEPRQGALGLDLIKLLVAQIKGTEKIESTPDQGMTITIIFPDPNNHF